MNEENLALRALQAIAEAKDAKGMIKIVNAHVSGVSYSNLGDYGLAFLEDLASRGLKVSVPTSSNPCGMDRNLWKEQGVPEDYAEKQLRVNRALEAMGVAPTYSCTFPYEGPWSKGLKVGDHVAWAESSAVVYGNSVLGVRTNREGGPSALFSGLTGFTPNYGMHLDENRKPTLLVRVEEPVPRGPFEWGLLGKKVGELGEVAKVVYIQGLGKVATAGELKALSAALATFGPTDMFLAPRLTPEAGPPPSSVREVVFYGDDLEDEARNALDGFISERGAPGEFFLGCPQYGVEELVYLARMLKGVDRIRGRLYVYTSSHAASQEAASEAISKLTQKGVKVFQDTCPVFSPFPAFPQGVMTDSFKSSFYMPQAKGVKAKVKPTVASFMLASGELEENGN